MYKIIILRHGRSEWNISNKFTGWADVDISTQGIQEALNASEVFKKHNIIFDMVFSSVLKRCIFTANIILEQLDIPWVPMYKTWKLNERHYGALQGLNKEYAIKKYGIDQITYWRRAFKSKPPIMPSSSLFSLEKDIRYKNLTKIPNAESLEDTKKRVINYWKSNIEKNVLNNKVVLIVSHGNALRALSMYLESLSESQILKLNIPTCTPILYCLGDNLEYISKEVLT